MKKNHLLAFALISLSLAALFAFTAAPVKREKIPAAVWNSFRLEQEKEAAATRPDQFFAHSPRRVFHKNELEIAQTKLDSNPPLKPRFGDFLNDKNNGSGIDLHDPKIVEKNVEYDPTTDRYIITEKIGDDYFRTPTYMTFSEYLDYQAAQQQQEYWDRLAGAAAEGRSVNGAVDPLARFSTKKSLVERLFGGTEVAIKPQGNIDLKFGVRHQNLENPTLTLRQRRQTNFDFDMNIAMNATGKIGEKLNLAFNYNTQATFDFDNTMKIHYDPLKGGFGEDEILQNIEAGNVSLPLRSTLIKGATKLFGLKTELKFGKLRLTTVISQQQTKQQTIKVQGGGQLQTFRIPIDEYDENRNFFLSQYNRNTFEHSLRCLPSVLSLFKITKIQVWVTNDNSGNDLQVGSANSNLQPPKTIVALADLGEPAPYLTSLKGGLPQKDLQGIDLPDNKANLLYDAISSDKDFRQKDQVVTKLSNLSVGPLQQVRDFEVLTARLLTPDKFSYHEDLGFVSITTNLKTDHVVGVAFEYTYNGIRHQVGEFGQDIANQNGTSQDSLKTDSLHQNVTFVKMLKPRISNVKLPIFDLMMKNIYAIGASQVDAKDFRFDIFYEDGKGEKRFFQDDPTLPVANPIANKPFLQIFKLDTLNAQRDPGPDGVFDFVPGLTINLKSGRIMFPVLEPFGDYLAKKLGPSVNDTLVHKYTFPQLYDSTLTRAREYLDKNRFTLRGTFKSANSRDISLGAFNVPQGSVRVSGGGKGILVEGSDYEIDYNIGKVRILNDALLQSGQPIQISFEDNTLFGFNQRTMLGLRADYELDKHTSFGATLMNLFERPLTQKVNFGDDPINNKMYGADFNYSKEAPFLTRLVDKIPLIDTKAPSNITFQAEVAALRPGHSKAINNKGLDDGGVVYMDDFEGSSTGFDLRNPAISWVLASIPQNDWNGRWPESKLVNDLAINANRAHFIWYNADPSARITSDNANPYTQVIPQEEIFPNKELTPLDNSYLRTFDLTLNPKERGPYNFEIPGGYATSKGYTGSLTAELAEPKTRWAGIMRGLTTNDFEQANIEFLEFWMLDPFINKTTNTDGGKLILQLGSVSEDIIKDGNAFYENGLPTAKNSTATVTTNMGRFPFYQPLSPSFDLDPAARKAQDVGLDGLDSLDEITQFGPWLSQLAQPGGSQPALSQTAIAEIKKDVSNDDYEFYRSDKFTSSDGLLKRYSRYNNTEGNTPPAANQGISQSGTQYPDIEDFNRDNTFNESESYFSYELPIENDGTGLMKFKGTDLEPYVTESIERVDAANPNLKRTWYKIKIPLENNKLRHAVGGIQDFRSIEFIRLIATGFEDTVTMRFATFELGRNQWRRYKQPLLSETCPSDFGAATSTASLDITGVNIEENSDRQPFNYVLPPGIKRETSVGAFQALQNEQSLAMSVCDLQACDARGIYKLIDFDIRQFDRLKMFVHAANVPDYPQQWKKGDLQLFIRIGSDFTKNFYEYAFPLTPSVLDVPRSDLAAYSNNVWHEDNRMDFPLSLLTDLKKERNKTNADLTKLYVKNDPDKPSNQAKIIGNPNLGLIKGVLIGIRNVDQDSAIIHSGGPTHCAEIWLNELRLTGINEQASFAALARTDFKLADFADVQGAITYKGVGWRGIEEKVQQQSLDENIQVDLATSVELDKFLGDKSGVKVPFAAAYSSNVKNPEYDPYDLDLKLKDKIRDAPTADSARTIKRQAQDATVIKGFNFTNVRVDKKSGGDKKLSAPWAISNFSLTYAYNQTDKRNPFIIRDRLKQYKGGLDYNWAVGLKPITPFKKLIKKDKYLKFITDFNFNPLPTSIGMNSNLERIKQATTYRFAGSNETQNTFYNKRFTWDRSYNLNWDLAKSLKFSYDATAKSIIDEPNEYDYTQKQIKDSILTNLKKLGRLKNFQQNMTASFALPFKTIPMMDWVTSKASLSASYGWDAASLKTPEFGNTIQNNQTRQINTDLNFETLYNKSKYLAKINKPITTAAGGKGKKGKGESGAPGIPGGRGGGMDDGGGGGLEPVPGGRGGKGRESAGGVAAGSDLSGAPSKSRADRNQPQPPADSSKGGISPAGGRPSAIPGGRPAGAPGGVGGLDPASGGGGPTEELGADGKPIKSAGSAGAGGKAKKQKEREVSIFERVLIRPLMTVRKARFNYTETYSTVLPGFLPNAKLLGQDKGFNAPGWDFIFGQQPNQARLNSDAAKGWITRDIFQSQQVLRNFTQNFEAAATLEPFTDFRVELTANRQYSKNNTELFKVPDQNSLDFEHRAQRDMGSLTLSYYNMQTLWTNDIDGLFHSFENARPVISTRLGVAANITDPHQTDKGYRFGYGKIQQDVLVPAFIAAYTKQDANTVGLNVFNTMPKVNWKLTYNGLSKLNAFKKVFTDFKLSHGYKSTLTINSYATNLQYDANQPYSQDNINNLNNSFYSRYEMPQIVISEQLSPLLGLDMNFKSGMTFKVDMKKTRNLGMSFIDYQLAEQKTTDYTISWGYKLKNVYLPFLYGKAGKAKVKKAKAAAKKKIKIEKDAPPEPAGKSATTKGNDLKFDFNFSFRDDITTNHSLDKAQNAEATRGTRTIRFNPTVDYSLNKQLSLGLYCDYNKSIPKTTASFPITNLQAGLRVRFQLQ